MTLKTENASHILATDIKNTQIYLSLKTNAFRFLQSKSWVYTIFLDWIYFIRQGRQQCDFVARGWIALQSHTCKEAQLEDKGPNCYVRLNYLLPHDLPILLPSQTTQQTWFDKFINNFFLILNLDHKLSKKTSIFMYLNSI